MKIGDTVSAVDEVISGIVKKLEGATVLIETEDGFEILFQQHEVVVESQEMNVFVSKKEVSAIISEKEEKRRPKILRKSKREKVVPPMEVDLHIHQLTAATNLSNYEMLTLQLDTAKRQLEFAIAKRIQKVVFIHGVGEGVLKTELEYLFRRYDRVTFYDANYQKYGVGATEVYIYQNQNR